MGSHPAAPSTSRTQFDILVDDSTSDNSLRIATKFDSAEMLQSPPLSSPWVCGLLQRNREPQGQDGVETVMGVLV